jgi:hypothetical protein
MTLEIHKAELEELIRQRMQSGAYQDVDDLLLQALRLPQLNSATVRSAQELHRRRLVEWLDSAGAGWNLELHPELAQGAADWVDRLRREDEALETRTS